MPLTSRKYMTAAINVLHLSKDFKVDSTTTRVLHDISTTINMGELTMIIGPSGCGKTTLISIISGILSATEGTVDILGERLNNMSDRQKVLFRRSNIGFIFQQYNLLPSITAAENASLALLAAGIYYDEAKAIARKVLATINMGAQADKLPKQLSGGELQRVAIARALVHEPQLILCDEPTAALDAKTGQSVMDVLRKIANDAKRAVVVITHDERIYKYADRVLEMSDGKIINDNRQHTIMNSN